MAETGPGGNSHSLKRRWFELYGEASTPPRLAKRVAKSKHYEKDDYRKEIAGVYAAYDALFKACKEGHAQETDFVALLKAAEGSEPTKRLVARLLPRFVKYFPKHARATGDVLTDLAQLSLGDAPATAAETRGDALRGLCAVVSAAKLEADHQTAIKLVDYAFRQLKSHPAACIPPSPLPNGTPAAPHQDPPLSPTPGSPSSSPPPPAAAGGAAGATTPRKGDSLASQAAAPYWSLLEAAFTHFPRVVLAACIHSLKRPSQHPQLFAAARQFVLERLLGPRGAARTAHAAKTDADAEGAVAAAVAPSSPSSKRPSEAGAGQQQAPSPCGGAGGEESGSGAAAPSRRPGPEAEVAAQNAAVLLGGASLFKEVMLAEDREQRWFRQHVQQFLQELPAASAADVCMVLQQLVRELPPSPQRPKQQQQQQSPGMPSPSGGQQPGRESPTGREGLVLMNGPQHAQHDVSRQQAQQQQQQHRGGPLAAKQPPGRGHTPRGGGGPPLHPPNAPPFRSGSSQDLTQGPTPGRGPSPQGPGHPPSGTPGAAGGRPRHGQAFDEPPPSASNPTERAEGRPGRGAGAGAGAAGWGSSRHAATPMDVDGGEGAAGGAPSGRLSDGGGGEPSLPAPLPPPGDNICLAAACLWVHGLPAYLDESDVSKECGRHGRVAGAVMPPPTPGQPCVAYVNFVSVRDAMRCYEAMYDAAPWRSCLPLDIRFCSSEAFPPTAPPPPPQQPPCTHTWVAGVSNMGEEGEVLRCCKEGGVPAPEHLLRVGGRRPGLLLSFATQAAAAAAVSAVQGGNLRLSGLLPPGPPGGRILPCQTLPCVTSPP